MLLPNSQVPCALLVVGLYLASAHAVAPWTMGMLVVLLAGLAFRIPKFWLLALPSIIFVGTFYPWTGSLFPQERDILLCGLIAGEKFRRYFELANEPREDRRTVWLSLRSSASWYWSPICLCLLIGIVQGWSQLPSRVVGDQLSVYTTRANTIQQALPVVWALLIVPMATSQLAVAAIGRDQTWRRLCAGVQVSAFVVALLTVAERMVTVGLFNFSEVLRATGPFTSMHIGGQHIDAFWALVLPFLVQLPKDRKFGAVALIGLQVFCAFAIFATMSRALIVYAIVSLPVLACLNFLLGDAGSVGVKSYARRNLAWVGFLIVCLTAFALWQIGDSVRSRFSTTVADFQRRVDHWTTIVHKSLEEPNSVWLGHGLGSYPATCRRWQYRPVQPIRLIEIGDQVAVQMYAGERIYLEQFVDARRPLPWQLTVDAKPTSRDSGLLQVHLCHKSLLQSYDCVTLNRDEDEGIIQCTINTLPTELMGQDGQSPALRRFCPTTLGFSASGVPGSAVEISSVRLVDAKGNSIVDNGDWSDGSQRWYFTSDDHLVWRAKNCWVHLWVELGIVGVLSFGWVFLGGLGAACYRFFFHKDSRALVVAYSLFGFLQMGLWGTLLDVPSLVMFLAYLLAVGRGIGK
ncbi:MAG: hypothetical protein R3C53_27375 [Pirellulaceae bacterium]